MTCRTGHPVFEANIAKAIAALDADMRLTIKEAAERHDLRPSTLRERYEIHRKGFIKSKPNTKPKVPQATQPKEPPPEEGRTQKAKILFIDIETLPNLGYFFDTFSDRQIPLDFIEKPKAICSIAYKWRGEDEPTVLYAATPYDDKDILEAIPELTCQADYVVGHYAEGFDFPFIEGRLLVNGLPALPPFATIDTYKLAKKRFKSTLNSNKLDHLAKLLGVGRKNKTDVMLWVRCARGEAEAIREMAEYNAQDIEVLEAVYEKLMPNVKSKLNANILYDDPIVRCPVCESENMIHKGYELKQSTFRHRYQCGDCNAWHTTSKAQKPDA